ncbi:nucleotidyl transferase AbiEii/AbiGii toxin family protein [Kribbella sp. NPDC000426]|uniref:nucleotidyl transferase AbiEii/AbiGii toxin family protein n=1 Tax=Kribbella sp. NPDC000426 TaxID=3154255 RepID=UPI003321AF91
MSLVQAISGDFEVHLTFETFFRGAASFAERHGLKFSDIVLDRGAQPLQPMVTVRASGTLEQMERLGREWTAKVQEENRFHSPVRIKIEAAPWNQGVPVEDVDAVDGRYFEHHVKLLLPDAAAGTLIALGSLLEPHQARLSRNARRHRDDGRHERFATQRCHHVGRTTSTARLEAMVIALREGGYEILEVEEEYVAYDSNLQLDHGWLEHYEPQVSAYEETARTAPLGSAGYPSTYKPLPDDPSVSQRATFDPALKHHAKAYRAGQPTFDDPELTTRWRATRRAAIDHLLRLIAASDWADKLVLRGSVTLREWFGDQAREPGDLDFIVFPHTIDFDSVEGLRLLDDVIAAVAAEPGPGLRAAEVARDEIWTYERVPGRRLVFPYEHEGLTGSVQLDFVYNERLPMEPERLPIGDAWLLTAGPELSLAWKILWLVTDGYPQGKDLYDAVLLAERTDVSRALIRQVLGPELKSSDFDPASVLAWDVDWRNFLDEYPWIEGTAEAWKQRLALALERSFHGT